MRQKVSRILLILSTVFVAALAAVMLQSPAFAGAQTQPAHNRQQPPGYTTPTFIPRPSSYAFGPPPPVYNKPRNARGAYAKNGVWHGSRWWAKNDPSWVQQHHPTWLGMRQGQHRNQAQG